MMCERSCLSFVLCLSVCLLLFVAVMPATVSSDLIVDDDGPADYEVIQDAIDAAAYGETVLVMPGRYYQWHTRDIPGYGTVTANVFLKTGIRLQGSGAGVTHIEANSEDMNHSGCPVFAYQVEDAVLDGFHITGHLREDPYYQFWGPGVTLKGSEVEMAHNIVDSFIPPGCQFFACCVQLDNSSSNVHNNVFFYADDINVSSRDSDISRICNNVIHGGHDSLVCIGVYYNAHPLIANNIITQAAFGIECFEGDPTIQNNDLVDLVDPYIDCEQGPGDISADPRFVMPQAGNVFDFHLRHDSPCIDAGTDVGLPYNGEAPDMGAFEFTPYMRFEMSTVVIPGGGGVCPRPYVLIAPDEVVLISGQQQQFAATVYGTRSQNVIWYVNDIPGGNTAFGIISPSGLYTAPYVTRELTVTIKAISTVLHEAQGTAPVTVLPPILPVDSKIRW